MTHTLTADQILLHRTGGDGKPVISRFNASCYNFPLDMKVTHNIPYNKLGSGSEHTDTLKCDFDNNKFDNVRRVYFAFKIPAVSVNPKWAGRMQICWTHRPVHHIVGNTLLTMKINKNGTNKETGTFFTDSMWSDLYYTYFIKNKDSYDDDEGMLGDELCSWSTELPETQVTHSLPWIWSEHLCQSLPVHNNSGIVVMDSSFTISAAEQIKKFLRVRIRVNPGCGLEGGDYVYLCPTDSLVKFTTGGPDFVHSGSAYDGVEPSSRNTFEEHSQQTSHTTNGHFIRKQEVDGSSDSDDDDKGSVVPTTSLRRISPSHQSSHVSSGRRRRARRARRTRVGRLRSSAYSDRAIDFLSFDAKLYPPRIHVSGTKQDPEYLSMHVTKLPIIKYFTYDVMPIIREEMSPGSKKTFTLAGFDLHHSIYIIARNLRAESHNYYSNYTTNSIDHSIGINPIRSVKISVGDRTVFCGDVTILRKVAKESFASYPEEAGYNAYSFAFNPLSPHNDTSFVSFGSTTITIEISLVNLSEGEEDTRFNITIYSNVKRQVVHNRKTHDIKVLRDNFVK